MCQGGHGRTGTALAILGCLLGVIPEGADPVVWVREHYCLEAVETSKQISYIEKITERKVKATASSGWGQYGGTYGAWEGWDD
jgi:protein-tyrosine phosphatase